MLLTTFTLNNKHKYNCIVKNTAKIYKIIHIVFDTIIFFRTTC